MKLQVLLADDHEIIRHSLSRMIAETDDLEVAGVAEDGNAVMHMVRARDWDLVVLDLSMPGRSGTELINLIKSERPRLPILVFTMHPEHQYAVRSIRAGATGYLSKDSSCEQIIPAMRKVAARGVAISEKVSELLVADVSHGFEVQSHTSLSAREYQVFMRLVRGVASSKIAEELSLSVKTVSTYKTRILEKMGLETQADIVRYAYENSLLDSNDQ
jgi:two-component system, NarL family, invasion response regulator UvrY